jgi:myo-inositol 2-dehydrogenase / D-chiro-inositol 1-dehydrogenase
MSDQNSRPVARTTTRRAFLQSSVVTAAALAGSLAIRRAAHAAGTDSLKLGLIGCGGRGAGAVASALEVDKSATLIAMADAFDDRTREARDALRAQWGERIAVDDGHCFGGFDAYRQVLESGVDVVLLAEAPHFRPAHIEAAIQAGVHVFAEKPMAVDAPGVRSVLAAGELARQKNVSLVSGFETRYSAAAREAVQRVHDGQIGRILAMQSTYNTGPLWHRGRPSDWTEMQFQLRNWYYFTWLSGDHLVEQHVHYNDFIGWIMREQPPKHAWGYGGRQVRTEAKFGDIFDHHAVVYEYDDGARYYAFTRQQPGCFNENSRVVLGTLGQLSSEHGMSILKPDGQVVWTAPREERHPELTCFDEMFAAMRAGTPINDSLSMARSTMFAILGRMATHGGQRVTWDDAFASQLELAPKRYAWDANPPVMPGPDGQYPIPMPGVTVVL